MLARIIFIRHSEAKGKQDKARQLLAHLEAWQHAGRCGEARQGKERPRAQCWEEGEQRVP